MIQWNLAGWQILAKKKNKENMKEKEFQEVLLKIQGDNDPEFTTAAFDCLKNSFFFGIQEQI